MLPFPLGKCWNERMVWADMFIIKSKWGGGGYKKRVRLTNYIHLIKSNCSLQYKNPTKCICLAQSRDYHSLLKIQPVVSVIQLKSYSLGIKQQSLIHSPYSLLYLVPTYSQNIVPISYKQALNQRTLTGMETIVQNSLICYNTLPC